MKIREYLIETEKKNIDIRLCVLSDLHSLPSNECLSSVNSVKADMILCAGDMLERLDGAYDTKNERGIDFLSELSKIAPTYYTFGNHECFGSHKEMRRNPVKNAFLSEKNLQIIKKTGVVLLNNEFILVDGLSICGIVPGSEPYDELLLKEFSRLEGYKVLVFHQPEYYDRYKDFDFDIMISGHTHGGQWKLFGRGAYAPDQGVFPKYSSGVYDNRLVVSAGMSNPQRPIPRIFNPKEILLLHIKST